MVKERGSRTIYRMYTYTNVGVAAIAELRSAHDPVLYRFIRLNHGLIQFNYGLRDASRTEFVYDSVPYLLWGL